MLNIVHSEEATYQELLDKLQYLVDYLDDRGYLYKGIFIFPDNYHWPSTRIRNASDG